MTQITNQGNSPLLFLLIGLRMDTCYTPISRKDNHLKSGFTLGQSTIVKWFSLFREDVKGLFVVDIEDDEALREKGVLFEVG